MDWGDFEKLACFSVPQCDPGAAAAATAESVAVEAAAVETRAAGGVEIVEGAEVAGAVAATTAENVAVGGGFRCELSSKSKASGTGCGSDIREQAYASC